MHCLIAVRVVSNITYHLILYIVESTEVVGCYRREGSGSFYTARSTCQSVDGHLIGIRSALENNAVASK